MQGAGRVAARWLPWLLAWTFLVESSHPQEARAGHSAGISIEEPREGALLVDGRTRIAWNLAGCSGWAAGGTGVEVRVTLDGDILAVLVSPRGLVTSVQESHLLGAPPGQHTIRVSASKSAAGMATPGGVDTLGRDGAGATDETECSGTIRFLSIAKDAGEWTEELAELRGRPLRPEALLERLDGAVLAAEQEQQAVRERILRSCGGARSLAASPPDVACASPTQTRAPPALSDEGLRCIPACCRLVNRCVRAPPVGSAGGVGGEGGGGHGEGGAGAGGEQGGEGGEEGGEGKEAGWDELGEAYAALDARHRGFYLISQIGSIN